MKRDEIIIDFHTHAFPDTLADRAISHLEEMSDCKACLDGRVSSLIESMDQAGISASVVASIATKPKQFTPIMEFCKNIASDRIIPFTSLHPEDPDLDDRIGQTVDAGIVGVKLHPYYQQFRLDDEKLLFPVYEKLTDAGLIVLMHTGFDFAFPQDRICDPIRIVLRILLTSP